MELNYWGIDPQLFKAHQISKPENKFDKITELMSRPLHDIFKANSSQEDDFFFKHLDSNRIDFEE